MRWYVDISSIGSGDQKSRFCVEAEQWQKALQLVRAKRGDEGPFGHFSIELLDEGYRAIDPLTRTRYVVQRAPDEAPLSEGVAIDDEKTSVGGRPKGAGVPEAKPSRPRASNRGTASRASERGRLARGKAPSIPDDPVPRTTASATEASGATEQKVSDAAASTKAAAETTLASRKSKPPETTPPRSNGASSPSAVPLVAPKPMQAETAFERMTGGSAVSLPTSVSPSAELQTEVLPVFKVLSRRSEDPTPSSPLTYREMALTVASTTSLRDAEAIARAQFEVIRNAISGAPKGKFIQLAVFDHEFAGKPQKAPIVTLSFKDWRNVEPDLRFPLRDGAGPASLRSSLASMPPASTPPPPATSTAAPSTAAPSVVAPSTVEAPTVPVLPDTVVRTIVPSSLARPTVEPPTVPAITVPEPTRPVPSEDVAPPQPASAEVEVIKPAPIIAVIGSETPAPAPVSAEPPPAPEPPAPEPPAPVAAAKQVIDEPAPPTVPSEPPPAPTSSQIRAQAKDMAGDDEKTLVKPSTPPPAPQPPEPEPVPVLTRTTKMAAVSAPPPAGPNVQAPSVPPPAPVPGSIPPAAAAAEARHASITPAAAVPGSIPPGPMAGARPASIPPGPMAGARPASIPPGPMAGARPASIPPAPIPVAPPPGPPLLVRQANGPRRSGDDLITDLFEACSDLNFLNDILEGADFVLALALDSIPSAIALCSFFDINTREMVVVRQAVTPGFKGLPNVLNTRASEFTPLIARTMRAGRALVVPATDAGVFTEDPRWRGLGVTPKSAISTPVLAGGRYLGLIEVADPLDEAPFTEADGHALTYIGQQFSEYLAQRDIDVSAERILRPKLGQLARR